MDTTPNPRRPRRPSALTGHPSGSARSADRSDAGTGPPGSEHHTHDHYSRPDDHNHATYPACHGKWARATFLWPRTPLVLSLRSRFPNTFSRGAGFVCRGHEPSRCTPQSASRFGEHRLHQLRIVVHDVARRQSRAESERNDAPAEIPAIRSNESAMLTFRSCSRRARPEQRTGPSHHPRPGPRSESGRRARVHEPVGRCPSREPRSLVGGYRRCARGSSAGRSVSAPRNYTHVGNGTGGHRDFPWAKVRGSVPRRRR